jgi:N-acetyl-S-(2-succino)cysteine monooxygenase
MPPVLPELRRRGLFRIKYEGRTLRDNLGLTRPINRRAAQRQATEAA